MSKLRTTIALGILVALSASVLGFSAGPLAVATGGDTCTSPTPITSLPYNDTGDTSSATNQMLFLSTACVGGGASSRPGPDLIYSFTVAGGNSLTFTVTPSQTGLDAYDPAIYILGACGTGSSCVHAADVGSYGEPETIGPITLAPGTYYFYVDSVYSFEEPGVSGPYSLSVTGSLGSSAGSRFYTLTPAA